MSFSDIQVLGLICTLDLFPIPDSFAPYQANGNHTEKSSTPDSSIHCFKNNQGGIFPFQSEDIVHHLENYPILESSKQTKALAGATFVEAVKLEYMGKKALLFAFSVNYFLLLCSCFISFFSFHHKILIIFS